MSAVVQTQADAVPAGAPPPSRPATRRHARQYARIWRWHFFAGLLVVPFILWQGVTGVAYLWHEEIADALWPQLRLVEPRGSMVPLDRQLAAARAANANADAMPVRVLRAADRSRSTQFVFSHGNGLSRPTFVDPYSGRLLGSVPARTWLPGLTRSLHGGWPLGRVGSWLLELGACWCIVMVLSGLYLWWPRAARGMAGVLYPRLRHGARVFWRDLHAVVGIGFSAVLLAFLITALPWTDFWGGQVLKPLQRWSGQIAPDIRGNGAHHPPGAHAGHSARAPALQRMVDLAASEGLRGDLQIDLARDGGPVTVAMKSGRAANERVLRVAPDGERVIARIGWHDYPAIPRLVATGVDLHEGTFLGRANRIANTVVVGALFWLVVTGAIGWYRRRPSEGGLSAPPPQAGLLPRWLMAVAIALCVAMPLLGISVVLLWLVDGALGALGRWRRRE